MEDQAVGIKRKADANLKDQVCPISFVIPPSSAFNCVHIYVDREW